MVYVWIFGGEGEFLKYNDDHDDFVAFGSGNHNKKKSY